MKILESIKRFAEEGRKALICDGQELTYKNLDEFSDNLAQYLLTEYEQDRSPIIIYGNKDNLILVSMLACLKSGHAYIPLDVTFPVERVKEVIKEVSPKVMINFTDLDDFHDIDVVNKEKLSKIISQRHNSFESLEDYWVKEDENAYILFTSGSTGRPKGVQISKNNIDSFENWFSEYMNLDSENDVMMNQVSYSFDVSVIPIYLGLSYGKTLHSLSKNTLENFKELFKQFRESNIRTWVSTPALAELCINDSSFNVDLLPKLDTIFFAGEVLSKKLVSELMNRFPDCRIINGYGPTEATVLISAVDINKEMIEDDRALPIGYPMKGAVLKVVDKDGKEVNPGEKGELIALGNSVSKGYFNNKEMTDKVFFEEEIDGKKYRGYKTGDVVYYDGEILYYCGRKDFQIKLNGFRIELEDIENNLRKVRNIKNTVVLPVFKDGKVSYLNAFVSLENKGELSNLKQSIIIKNELKRYIPDYMVPRIIKILDEFPININGKIDRKKLMEELG
ncbi:MAG: D-alanine--poly(phosphoribitol) ligase subunit DltA [Clostridiaceae bacterium]